MGLIELNAQVLMRRASLSRHEYESAPFFPQRRRMARQRRFAKPTASVRQSDTPLLRFDVDNRRRKQRRERTRVEVESTHKELLYTAHHVDHSRGKCSDKALKRSGHLRSSKMLLCRSPRTGSRCARSDKVSNTEPKYTASTLQNDASTGWLSKGCA